MVLWALHYDMRAPAFGPPAPALYRAALDQVAWADAQGVASVVLSEHHGEEDGYLPSPLTMAAAVAAVTRNTFISINALVLTLRDPVAAAEDVLVLDNLSDGRVMVNLVPGYVPSEFAMFGLEPADRIELFEAKVAAFTAAITGEPFEWQGRTIRVTPAPVQRPRPMVTLGGASKAGARRAARLGDGFFPPVKDAALDAAYLGECERLGKPPGMLGSHDGPLSLHIAHDIDAAWDAIGPHLLHEFQAYGRMAEAAGEVHHPYVGLADLDAARNSGLVEVLTPEQCVEHIRAQGDAALVVLKPLIGGLDPEEGWSSLRLFVDEVLPAV